MKIQLLKYENSNWNIDFTTPGFDPTLVQLVLAFGEPEIIANPNIYHTLKEQFPGADIICSSAAGEIIHFEVFEEGIVVTAIQLEQTGLRCAVVNSFAGSNSFEVGRSLMKTLYDKNINSVIVIAGGPHINGSELVAGFNDGNIVNGKIIPVTGGMAGGNAVDRKTYVGLNEVPAPGNVVAIGFYGTSLKIGHGIYGGWAEFGPERQITRSDKNILYEIDGKNALELYNEYLGPFRIETPGTNLLFPLSVKGPNSTEKVTRTILKINDQDKSLIYAGNVPEGSKVRLMRANTEKLINGSQMAAKRAFESIPDTRPDLIMIVSCMGRKLVMKERTEEEVEEIQKVFNSPIPICGFYSYGEVSPIHPGQLCEFHNQTMTITTFEEKY